MENLSLAYQLVIQNTNGLSVSDTGVLPCHSFTKQFAQIIFNMPPFSCSTFSPIPVTNTTGVSVTSAGSFTSARMSLRTDAGTTTSTYGIQVGGGTNAESINDTSLQTQIVHGTSAGQLQYGSMTYGAPSTTATTTTFRCTRVFTNASGFSVSVEEIGLTSLSLNQSNTFLLIRDLTGTVAVGTGQQLTVNYDFTTTI